MSIAFDLEGIEELAADFRKARFEVSVGMSRAVLTAVQEGVIEAKSKHVYKDRTGDLTGSIIGKMLTVTQDQATGEISTPIKYASYVENGTRAHDIWPKEGHGFIGPLKGKGQSRRTKTDIGTHRVALRWYDDGGGVHFARMVHHPETPPHPFMGIALLKAERVIVREMEMVMAQIAKRFH